MKKRLVSFIGLMVISFSALAGLFSGCGFISDLAATKVSTFDELKSASGEIKLMNDIDCEYETIEAIFCSKFDGQGYSIKNCIITSSDYYDEASFFGRSTKTIENVTFENITVKGSSGLGAAVVSVGGASKISNVHIKNSKVSCGQCIYGSGFGRSVQKSYIGGILGGYYPSLQNGNPTEGFDCEISNCTVDGLEIELNGYNNSSSSGTSMYAGGIAGGGNNISNCFITNCKISATATSIYNYPHVGGIVGYSEGSIENSFAKDSTISANANYYSKGAFSLYSTSCAYLGGIAAYIKGNGNIKYCYGDGNSFYANSSGDIYVGGLIGYVDKTSVNQSYAKATYISMDKYAEGNANSVSRRAGGLIGSSNNNSVISCFAYNDNVLAEQCSGFKSSTDSKVAGLIAGFNTISVMNCATYNNNLVSVTTDEFIPYELDGLNKCYVSNTKFGNINNIEVLSDDFWNAPNTIKSSLNLVGIYWRLTTNNLPYLDFSGIE